MRVKCLAQEHNTMTWPGLKLRPLDLVSSALTTRPPHPPHTVNDLMINGSFYYVFFLFTAELNGTTTRAMYQEFGLDLED